MQTEPTNQQKPSLRSLPRNVWAVSLTSFFMDISSEMVINILPLFLANVLGVRTNIIGLIEGLAESTASSPAGSPTGWAPVSGWLSPDMASPPWSNHSFILPNPGGRFG